MEKIDYVGLLAIRGYTLLISLFGEYEQYAHVVIGNASILVLVTVTMLAYDRTMSLVRDIGLRLLVVAALACLTALLAICTFRAVLFVYKFESIEPLEAVVNESRAYVRASIYDTLVGALKQL